MTISKRLTQKFGSPERGVVRALRNEIQHALSEHWTAKQIWEDLFLNGSVGCSYRTFCRYLDKEDIWKKSTAFGVNDLKPLNLTAEKMASKNENNNVINKFIFERIDINDLV